ncbi:ESCRT-II complex subunit-domain-containing protein [Lasiosphaeria miniovina]|uniref:ESCRT-II complex subunit VPS25 n=1 Tax=Lasiosphaeria miniovina TaxID=1954250 RepID=A0AA40DRX4_9PEZI|nr:ESCRT-II complex subunit-domain-containing protein [Lasiosphaeria miniovina]KAK0709743.1 ESCRT-II complex subunit-domain-containing protein [Lasiosphaeria miniovina]
MQSPAAGASPSPAPGTAAFTFPREYYFPPFFTWQTNLTTHHAQLTKWAALVLAYCRHHRIFRLALSTGMSASAPMTAGGGGDSSHADGGGGAGELFHNRQIGRRIGLADAREVVDFLRKDGRAEYVGGAGDDGEGFGGGNSSGVGGGGDVAWIYWRTPEEWAALVEAWVDETGQKGSVLTLYELTEGDATRGTEFHGLDPELLQKALHVLVKRAKAQIFGHEDSQGVKFF